MVANDPSFVKDGRVKGSYKRALEDIDRALDYLNANKLRHQGAFIYYYLACEKLAKIMKGVCCNKPKKDVFNSRSPTPSASDICQYVKKMGGSVNQNDVESIFDSRTPNSARVLRNNLFHEIGPSNAKKVMMHSSELLPKMKRFLHYKELVNACIG